MYATFIITSPSKQFTQMAKSVMKELQFKAVIFESVLEEAVEKVLAFSAKQDITAIISRGGTASMIRQALDIPVLTAAANDFDILFAMKNATVVSSRIAYVLSEADVTAELPRITEFLPIDVKLFPFSSTPEINTAIRRAEQEGYEAFVSGSGIVRERCTAVGLPCEIINTSWRTMKEIIRRAQLILEVKKREAEASLKIQVTFDMLPQGIIFLDSGHRMASLNKAALEIFGHSSGFGIQGKAPGEFIQDKSLGSALSDRRKLSGLLVEIAGKMFLLQSQPVFVEQEFIGTVLTLQSALELEKQEQNVRRQSHAIGMVAKTTFGDLAATALSRSMRDCLEKAARYAKTDHTVLIEGESGTGKEMIAQSIHNASSRRQQPFVAINCAALPQSLLESELFGYDEGAFTGAKRGGKPGYFELAHCGTLFLDELGLIPMHVQVQLLRVLQERQVLRIGGRRMIPIDVRIIAATNADLMKAVSAGDFRQDLFYRMHVLYLGLPPLRERREDIRPLIDLYLKKFSQDSGIRVACRDERLIRAFKAYAWPGNVRELMNYILRLALCAKGGELSHKDLREAGIALRSSAQTVAVTNAGGLLPDDIIPVRPGTMEAMAREIIQWYMSKYGDSRGKVCERLDISRTTLWKKLKQQ